MDGQAKYIVLINGADNLVSYSKQLDTPISGFEKQMNIFREVYQGNASDAVLPVLQKIKKDVEALQVECAEFAAIVKADVEDYIGADRMAEIEMHKVV